MGPAARQQSRYFERISKLVIYRHPKVIIKEKLDAHESTYCMRTSKRKDLIYSIKTVCYVAYAMHAFMKLMEFSTIAAITNRAIMTIVRIVLTGDWSQLLWITVR